MRILVKKRVNMDRVKAALIDVFLILAIVASFILFLYVLLNRLALT